MGGRAGVGGGGQGEDDEGGRHVYHRWDHMRGKLNERCVSEPRQFIVAKCMLDDARAHINGGKGSPGKEEKEKEKRIAQSHLGAA